MLHSTISLPSIDIVVRLSDTKHEYERQVYTVFALIGDIGGFNGAIIMLPTFLMTRYSQCMYKSAIQEEIPTRKTKKRRLGQHNTASQH